MYLSDVITILGIFENVYGILCYGFYLLLIISTVDTIGSEIVAATLTCGTYLSSWRKDLPVDARYSLLPRVRQTFRDMNLIIYCTKKTHLVSLFLEEISSSEP